MLPHYLAAKLSAYGINNINQLRQQGIFYPFKWLRYDYPSTSYNVLYDLYALANDMSLDEVNASHKKYLRKVFNLILPTYPPLADEVTDLYMEQALEQAQLAFNDNEVPVGAVIVYNNEVIAVGHNQTIKTRNILKHAEIVALENAQRYLNNFRLDECDLYVTIEPCLMCCGAILHARIRRMVFGAFEPKTGAILSQNSILDNRNLNHHTEAIGPINNSRFSAPLQEFFKQKRNINNSNEII
jgi:tRNA(adenine34) deaminase